MGGSVREISAWIYTRRPGNTMVLNLYGKFVADRVRGKYYGIGFSHLIGGDGTQSLYIIFYLGPNSWNPYG